MTRRASFAAVLCVALVGGCSADPTNSAEPATPTDASNVCERFSGIGATADYRPANSPSELSERSELVVEGTLDEVAPARTFHPDDVVPAKSVVMVMKVTGTHKGTLPSGSRGRIYVESQPHGNLSASHFDRLLPRDASVLMYLTARVPLGGELPPVKDPDGGRPLGQPLWQLTTPQGFLIEFGADGVVQVPECKRYPEAELADFRPDRREFPNEPGATQKEAGNRPGG